MTRIVNSTCASAGGVGTLQVHMAQPKSSSEAPSRPASAWQRCMQVFGAGSPPAPRVERPSRKAEAVVPAAPAEAQEHPLLADLTALLDAVPDSRKLLRHLAGVEHGLKKKDPTGMFLFRVESPVLKTALRQLDGLLPPTPARGLSALRARIASAIAAHDKREKTQEMLAPRSDIMQASKLEIGEARVSDFDRLSEQWRGKPAA